MSFMKEQIVYDRWVEIDSREGTFYIPQSLIGETAEPTVKDCRDYLPCSAENVLSLRIVDGYGARLSAPGYMDCTEWSVFKTKKEAQSFLEEMYSDD